MSHTVDPLMCFSWQQPDINSFVWEKKKKKKKSNVISQLLVVLRRNPIVVLRLAGLREQAQMSTPQIPVEPVAPV